MLAVKRQIHDHSSIPRNSNRDLNTSLKSEDKSKTVINDSAFSELKKFD